MHIFLIAYYFPPLGGAGVQRSLKLAKYLVQFGHHVTVLTVENADYRVTDLSMLSECEKMHIIRARHTIVKKNGKKELNRSESGNKNNWVTCVIKSSIRSLKIIYYRYFIWYRFIPDRYIGWRKNAVELALHFIQNNRIDIIISTSAPYTGHLVALDIKKVFPQIPWIADFRDPWVANHFTRIPFPVNQYHHFLEKSVVKNCDLLTTVSKPIADNFIQRYGKDTAIDVITNGYDEEDFKGFCNVKQPQKFVVMYNGTFYADIRPDVFLKVYFSLIEEDLINKNDTNLVVTGNYDDSKSILDNYQRKYSDVLILDPFISHQNSIKKMEGAAALLLIIDSKKNAEFIYTGKIFEYIRTGIPIIALVPNGVARDLINETQTGICAFPNNESEIREAILSAYAMWKNSASGLDIQWNKIRCYTREHLAKKFENCIQSLVNK